MTTKESELLTDAEAQLRVVWLPCISCGSEIGVLSSSPAHLSQLCDACSRKRKS